MCNSVADAELKERQRAFHHFVWKFMDFGIFVLQFFLSLLLFVLFYLDSFCFIFCYVLKVYEHGKSSITSFIR